MLNHNAKYYGDASSNRANLNEWLCVLYAAGKLLVKVYGPAVLRAYSLACATAFLAFVAYTAINSF